MVRLLAVLPCLFAVIAIRGEDAPKKDVPKFVSEFRAVERGIANEVAELAEFLNSHYADSVFNEVLFEDVQALARTCATGCDIVDRGDVALKADDTGFASRLARRADPAPRMAGRSRTDHCAFNSATVVTPWKRRESGWRNHGYDPSIRPRL